jgi:hypothetical protein
MTIELTEKFIGFVDIMGFKSLMARADAGNGMSHSELFDLLKLLGSDEDRAERIKPDWLAGVRGFELAHSRSNPVSARVPSNLGILPETTGSRGR